MPVPASQELDARFAVFLNPIRDLTKNWEVDIAKYLEEYLEELAEVQITFDGGETTMNFAEAAMLIQGSAAVYCKKVDFLWQIVLKMLELLSSKRIAEARLSSKESDADDRNIQDTTMDFSVVKNNEGGRSILLKDDEEERERKKQFKYLPATPMHLIDKDGEKPTNRIDLTLKSHETFGSKDDFRISHSFTPFKEFCVLIYVLLHWLRLQLSQ